MATKCLICGKSINKNQETEVYALKSGPGVVHSICAKGAKKGKRNKSNSHGHCTPGGGFNK